MDFCPDIGQQSAHCTHAATAPLYVLTVALALSVSLSISHWLSFSPHSGCHSLSFIHLTAALYNSFIPPRFNQNWQLHAIWSHCCYFECQHMCEILPPNRSEWCMSESRDIFRSKTPASHKHATPAPHHTTHHHHHNSTTPQHSHGMRHTNTTHQPHQHHAAASARPARRCSPSRSRSTDASWRNDRPMKSPNCGATAAVYSQPHSYRLLSTTHSYSLLSTTHSSSLLSTTHLRIFECRNVLTASIQHTRPTHKCREHCKAPTQIPFTSHLHSSARDRLYSCRT